MQAPLGEKLSGVGLAVPWVLSNLVSLSIYGLIKANKGYFWIKKIFLEGMYYEVWGLG